MKNNKLTILFFLAILISSCNKNNTGDYPELIVGGWTSTNITIEGNTTTKHLDSSVQLSIGDGSEFTRNYLIGSWSLDKSNLTLVPKDFFGTHDWDYKIIELTGDKLKVKIELTKEEYGWGFIEFEEDEILTIIETYSKQN